MPAYIGTKRGDFTDEPRDGWTGRAGVWVFRGGIGTVVRDYNAHPSSLYAGSVPGVDDAGKSLVYYRDTLAKAQQWVEEHTECSG